ncbi:hypothetical protein EYF80_026606 [Liparis tanakae]|uniref:Uncharacterized protein n=1 Tax=Liparis tanakae TaxID=230148 RepID=A0A4Z2HED2_9TELE|nr:hypothetical protein EYF80_026606 [Liparis tanakae]
MASDDINYGETIVGGERLERIQGKKAKTARTATPERTRHTATEDPAGWARCDITDWRTMYRTPETKNSRAPMSWTTESIPNTKVVLLRRGFTTVVSALSFSTNL